MSTNLLHQLASYGSFSVMVIGDYMLDQHVYGAAERLSPDAPVPVLQSTRQENRPGGASNVARCLRALHGNVHCIGVVGNDAEGQLLREALVEEGCEVSGVLTDAARPTTVKRSFVGLAQHRHPQKMFRVDIESRESLDDTMRASLLDMIKAKIKDVDIVCLEDYDKGVCDETMCAEVIALCRELQVPVLVDPASIDDYSKYKGATAITPNRSEAERATGLDTPLEADALHNTDLARRLGEALDLEAVVLTLDRHGALLETRGGEPVVVPTVARSVYDVTGAGDMVLAALAGARANGLDWLEAVRFANAAAGLEVEVFGVVPIPFAHVQREILAQRGRLDGKVRTLEDLGVELAVCRSAGQKVILTNGCFDVIHIGHLKYLREAASRGDLLVVGVNSDEQVSAQKGDGRPVFKIEERLEILSEFRSIDYLVVFEEPTAETLIRAIKPDLYVKGGDYAIEQINEYPLLKELNIDVQVLGHQPGLGSTEVIKRFVQAYGK